MAIAALAVFQRFRWLLVAAILSFILILLGIGSDAGRNVVIPFVSRDHDGQDVAEIPLRLLPVGDSVTEGRWANGNNGYRLELRNQLVQQGRSVDFIGTMELGDENEDNQHEGWGGMVICIIQEKIMANGILTTHPNLVLLQAGTNDANEAFGLPPVEPHDTAIDRLENLMNAIFCEVPDTALIVAQIQDNHFGTENTARVQQFNSEIPALVTKKLAQGFKIGMVDQFKAVGNNLDTQGIHPNQTGYIKMAHAWFEAINALPSRWIQPARTPLTKAPWSWYRQQRTACNALKGWNRDLYITNMTIGNDTFPPHMDMRNWTRLHDP
ncbi:uncharacterized protein RCC_03242 [Ramularia collo-cygni]|uniref:SGNH hydrolase-type esterase domain-containing protein n=1 Tax=Ramularia collo-cygni TaxID=112498 RepID=A0A2D3URY1_9PEZI|nr:uncharacterized protein RCC_03242 [Ramularia collo-cygni]CZT17408.1 uncharacterized protein RCC_03242 [Ramularia collo-cygni]